MKRAKKYQERKSIHEQLMKRVREVDAAHRLQKSRLVQDIEIEYFVPALAGLVFVILLAVFSVFLVEKYFFENCCEVENNPEIITEVPEIFTSDLGLSAMTSAEKLQVFSHSQIISNTRVLDFAGYLAQVPKNTIFNFQSTEIPTRQIFYGLEAVAVRARDGEHLLAEALAQTQALRDLYNMDIRAAVLAISENNRAFFLNTHLNDILHKINSAQGLQLTLEHARVALETEYNAQKNKYENDLAQYNLAFENYDGNQAESAVQNLAQEKAQMESFAEKYNAYGGALVRLQNYTTALEKKRQVIESNFDALVAGVQVTFDNEVDLGLIQ